MRLSTKKQQTLLTLSVLLGLSSPVCAQDIQNNDVIVTPDVVVTATRTQEEVKAVPQTVEVITKEDIEQLGATDVYSALRLAANVDVTSAVMAGHNVMIRGMSTNHTLILIDGKRFAGEDTSATQNVYALGRLSLSNIERIEIVRGSASAQYGSDALGGVINIITKKSKEPSVMVGISTGSEAINNYYHIDFGKQGNFSSTFDMRFSDVRKNMQAGDEGSHSYGPIQDFNFAGTWDLGNDKEIDLTLGYYNEHTKADYADKYTSTGVFQTSKDKKEWYDYRRYDYSLGYSGKTDNSDYMIRTFYSRLDKENNLYNYRNNFPGPMENILGSMYPKYDWDKSINLDKAVSISQNYDVVFFDEYHDQKSIHEAELSFLQEMYKQNKDMILSMEMFERDVQPVMDKYLNDEITEIEFINNSRPWENYQTDYKPLVEFAKEKDMYVLASNIPRRIANQYTKVGDLALIEDKDKIYLPKKHLVEYERYYDKFKNYMSMSDGQSHMMMTPERIEALHKAQCLKDDTMAESIVEFLKEHKDTKVLHVQGSFHGDEHLGVVEKVNKLNPSLETQLLLKLNRIKCCSSECKRYSNTTLVKVKCIYLQVKRKR